MIITLILVTFASSLLSNADAGFARLTNEILNLLPSFDFNFADYQFNRIITRFILSIPVGAFLMGLIGGSAIKNEPEFKKENIEVYYPPLRLCTDNAGMIATQRIL